MVCGFVKAVVTTTTVKHALRDEGIAGIAGTIGQNHPEWIKADIPRRADLASEGLHRPICAFCDPKSAFARRKTRRKSFCDEDMRAVRFHAARDIGVEDMAPPSDHLARDDVLFEPYVTGICGTDLHEYIGGPIVTPHPPHLYTGATNLQILGHEFSARVKQVGAGSCHVKASDRISVQPLLCPRADCFAKCGLFHLSPRTTFVGLSVARPGPGGDGRAGGDQG